MGSGGLGKNLVGLHWVGLVFSCNLLRPCKCVILGIFCRFRFGVSVGMANPYLQQKLYIIYLGLLLKHPPYSVYHYVPCEESGHFPPSLGQQFNRKLTIEKQELLRMRGSQPLSIYTPAESGGEISQTDVRFL